MSDSHETKVEFGERLPSAVFALCQNSISVDDVYAGADFRKAAHEAAVDAELGTLPESANLARLRERVATAETTVNRAASELEKSEAELTQAILLDDASATTAARASMERCLDNQRIARHELAVLKAAAAEAAEAANLAAANLRATRGAEYRERLQAEIETAVSAAGKILSNPKLAAALASYTTANEALARTSRSHFPPTRAPWHATTPGVVR